MPDSLMTSKVSVQYTFPFRVRRWDTLRHGLTGFLDETGHELMTRLIAAQHDIDAQGSGGTCVVFDEFEGHLGEPASGERRRLRPTDSDASVRAAIRSYIGQDETSANHTFQVSRDPVCVELIDLLESYDAEATERLMRFVGDRLNDGGTPLLRDADLHLGEDRGTRAYIERRRPFVEAKITGADLLLLNPESVPDLAGRLPNGTGALRIRMTATLRLMATGFGCIALEARLVTRKGLGEWIHEIVYQANPRRDCDEACEVAAKAALSDELEAVAIEALELRDASRFEPILRSYDDRLNAAFASSRLKSLVNGATLVNADLVAEDIIDLANLDRGSARGDEPRFRWEHDGETYEGRMYEYYTFVANTLILRELASAIEAYPAMREFMTREEQRRDRASSLKRWRHEIAGGLVRLSIDRSLRLLDEHPYVSTFLSAPAPFKQTGEEALIDRFAESLVDYQPDLVRILMKSKWAGIRHDWAATSGALDNLFYSDLIYMAVDIRSTLCVYYVPTNATEYSLVPELAHGYKYLVELNETLQEQRILWYAYTLYDDEITRDLRSISSALDGLKEDTLNERFNQVIEGLTEIIRGIDRKKMALAEVMHDPLSRKAGSSVFAHLIARTNDAFQLDTLYRDLSNKLERLDMLGLHVAETVQQYTSMVLQEGTRSAQLTVEFLEAFIIAFYFTELVHLSYTELQKEQIFPLSQWWSFYALTFGIFLAVLPAITLVRRSRSKLAFTNPGWLDRLEQGGILLGPAILLGMVYLGGAVQAAEGAEGHVAFAWAPGAGLGFLAITAVYLAVVFGWRVIEHQVERAAH